MAEARPRGWLLWVLLLQAAQAQPYTPIHQPGYCAFYDECGKNPELSGSLAGLADVSCLNNTRAPRLTGDHLALLQRICPRLYAGPDATFACCSRKQLLSLEKSLAITKALLTRCPACADNFVSLHCHNTCSPDQSAFINVTRVVVRGAGKPPAVVAYEAFYRRSFAERTYDSCSRVRIPAAATLAVGAMCGVYGSALCNAQRWLNYQGDTSNGLAPLDITFHLWEPDQAAGSPMQPLDAELTPCNQSQGGAAACSCQDCAASCPAIARPEALDATFRLGRLGGLALIHILCSVLSLLTNFLVGTPPALSLSSTVSCHVVQKPRPCLLYFTHSKGEQHRAWRSRESSSDLQTLGPCVEGAPVSSCSPGSAPGPQGLLAAGPGQLRPGPHLHAGLILILEAHNHSCLETGPRSLGPQTVTGKKDTLGPGGRRGLRVREPVRLWGWSGLGIVWAPPRGPGVRPGGPGVRLVRDEMVMGLEVWRGWWVGLALGRGRGRGGSGSWEVLPLPPAPPLTFKDGTALALSCMADYGAPVFPFLAVGGYEGNDYSAAEALILTFSLNNYPPGDPRLAQARLWEGAFLEEVRAFQRQMAGTLQVTFMAERSLEDEISRTTAEDLPIFAISYLVIFLYISLALGSYTSWRRMPVDAKVTLGLGGVAVVLGAVMAAMGFFAYLSVPSSLVVLQVVPFLVLAVGADNIFIFVLEYQRLPRRPGERREAHIGRALGRVGPSMLLCSVSEAVCFFLGALTPMPAVRTFALTSGLALILDFLLQMSAFVALVSLDSRRQEGSRLDVCCCLRAQELPAPSSAISHLLSFVDRPFRSDSEHEGEEPALHRALCPARVWILCLSSLGQQAKHVSRFGVCRVCLSSAGCESFSLTQKIQYATEFPEQSYLAIPASSWVDDFIDWLTPSSCCRLYSFGPNKDQFCPSTVNSLGCLKNCMSFTGPVRPSVDQFHKYLPWFLSDPPNIKCPKGGLAAYSTSVKLDHDGQVLDPRPHTSPSASPPQTLRATCGSTGLAPASRFMAYHKPLKNSQDYTEALRAARALAANITAGLRKVPGTDPAFEVFPYTITNVFYEQYLTVVPEGLFMLSLCLVPTFAVCCLLLGMDLRSGLINLFSIIMILVDTVGFMALWGISYNAVSLINLVTAVGISVEFVSHITRSFAVSTKPTRLERAKEATISMGSAVFAGVAMTNLPGILILGLAKAQLIQIFFFRLNLLITLLGLLHGLVFLPVILSYLGPDINMALVLEQRRAEEAAAARTASCKKHSIPVRWANGTYVNRGFQHPAESGDSFGDPPPQSGEQL
uniref:NPC1 like intracellular cholesterol transporter 1 n=1 Tax=Myotis lucifugus TaxID=59463 RepID=G1PCU2_MYOLU